MTKSIITREPITHDLKIYPEFFSAVSTGVKRAELRKNDRDYRVGDTLHLMETPRGSCHQTGEFINVKITHIVDVGEWMPGYVLLSVELQESRKADSEPVAWTWQHLKQWHVTNDEERVRDLAWDGVKVEPLYRHAQPVLDGYVMVPMRLTAENGAKGSLSGEFSETKFVNCPECFGDDECETCDGSGRIEITVPITWTTIKDIWAKGVEHFAAAPQEVQVVSEKIEQSRKKIDRCDVCTEGARGGCGTCIFNGNFG
ncbi:MULTISPECIES: DUF3850 domain-containing protein [Klebsiella pneumoniae complex]|uniref:DUF3850 domain-containing protein n=1 Tax=Klebsiella pneumoniae complex TaxID=3390273 RepID=UPI0015D53434|nr:DUF3850 domain-containing protein [Klebsiella pneumoniae]MCX0256574.1 DUF3850 domain-containing protein [Klebsiella pneumoniae]HBQ0884171.1 DUF3850 domain-containing protein [Klebsiella pneumoniae]HBS6972659.1 DUF3850 domain-containing protein [Klebsiella pneumoniae]HBV5759743.1 DUF3850 domain-containing protein [Klebsiella pneumoniae]HCA9427509.1 DUF3850 domain-containing protein [Klebsiella pneumoniae]